jgi:hypothetical protein
MAGKGGGSAVTIERGVRDLLHEHLRGALEQLQDLDCAIENGQVDRAIELRDLAVFAFSLFEALGWGSADSRSEYELPLEGRVVSWLHEIRATQRADLDYDSDVLRGQQCGDDRLCYCGYSLRESVSITRGYIAQTLEELETIECLLSRVCEPQRAAL